MFAPMSLMTYDAARPYARSIKERVVARVMPRVGRRSRARHLQERSEALGAGDRDDCRLGGWRRRRRGDDKELPAPRRVTTRPARAAAIRRRLDDWETGRRVHDGRGLHDSGRGTIPYLYFRVPTHLTEDKWIQAIEIKPGARTHVHHVIAFTQKAGEELNPGAVLGPTYIGGVTPNKPGLVFEPGVARMLRGNSDNRHADALHDERHRGEGFARRWRSFTPSSRRPGWWRAASS